jgi:TatD DNase family protein
VEQITTIGIDVESSRRSVELAREFGVLASIGLHPNDSERLSDAVTKDLKEMVGAEGVVAVGESGLDFYRDSASAEAQFRAFDLHIDLAKQHDKALVIHTRDSIDDAIGHLAEVGPPERFVFHCWSGDEDQLRKALDIGANISFAGNVSFRSADNLRVAARLVPRDRVLIETDSPYLSPVPERGKPNEPARVALVGAAVAEARGESELEIARVTTENARRFFAVE